MSQIMTVGVNIYQKKTYVISRDREFNTYIHCPDGGNETPFAKVDLGTTKELSNLVKNGHPEITHILEGGTLPPTTCNPPIRSHSVRPSIRHSVHPSKGVLKPQNFPLPNGASSSPRMPRTAVQDMPCPSIRHSVHPSTAVLKPQNFSLPNGASSSPRMPRPAVQNMSSSGKSVPEMIRNRKRGRKRSTPRAIGFNPKVAKPNNIHQAPTHPDDQEHLLNNLKLQRTNSAVQIQISSNHSGVPVQNQTTNFVMPSQPHQNRYIVVNQNAQNNSFVRTVQNTPNSYCFVRTVQNTPNSFVRTVQNTPNSFVRTVQNTPNSFVRTVQNTPNSFVRTVQNTPNSFVRTVQNTPNRFVETVQNPPQISQRGPIHNPPTPFTGTFLRPQKSFAEPDKKPLQIPAIRPPPPGYHVSVARETISNGRGQKQKILKEV